MKVLQRLGAAVVAGTLLSAIVATAAFGAYGTLPNQVSVAGPSGTIVCKTPVTVSATVLDVNGNPVDNTKVTWSFKSGAQPGDTISPTTSMTNASGVATTTVTLACVAGSRTVDAKAGTSVGGAVLGITSTGLPPTSTVPAPAGTPTWELAIAALAVLAGLALVTRQAVVRR